MQTPRLYCAVSHADLAEVVGAVRQRTRGPLLAAGVSLGGLILGHYLAEHGASAAVDAAFVVSSPLDVIKGTNGPYAIENPLGICAVNKVMKCITNSNNIFFKLLSTKGVASVLSNFIYVNLSIDPS